MSLVPSTEASHGVLGDTSTLPLVSFVLLSGRSACPITGLAQVLKSYKFANAFSSVATRVKHLGQMRGGSWSLQLTGISRSAVTLDGHRLPSDLIIKILVTFLSGTLSEHSLHNISAAISISNAELKAILVLCTVLCCQVPTYRD